MNTKHVYQVEVTREGKWWMVSIPEIDGLTQARRLSEVEQMAREYITVTLDVRFSTVRVSMKLGRVGAVDHPDEYAQAIRARREEARRLEREAAEQAAHLARDLAAAEVPMRDIGTMLGVSHQRAHQLASLTPSP